MMVSPQPQNPPFGTHREQVYRACAALSNKVRLPWLPMRWQNLSFEVLTEPADLIQSFRLRFRAYADCGFISADDFPLGLEVDRFDDRAVHFIARCDFSGEVAGYTRLLTGKPSQMEDLLDISDYRLRYAERICELSRLIVYPKGQRFVGRGLRHVALRWAEEAGVTCIVGISLERQEEFFKRLRFLPMEPRRRCRYTGSHFRLLGGRWLYGNHFDVERNRLYVRELVKTEPEPDSPTNIDQRCF
jgi:N-acyl-L-homoserine lactone synthetase